MNERTVDMLIKLVEELPRAVCRCSPKEVESGHLTDCPMPELQDKANLLVIALQTDETLP